MLQFDEAALGALNAARARDMAAEVAAEAWEEEFSRAPLGGARAATREAALPILAETFAGCARYGIAEVGAIRDLMWIGLVIGMDPLGMEEFRPMLEDTLMHPLAKARHITLAFEAIVRIQGGAA